MPPMLDGRRGAGMLCSIDDEEHEVERSADLARILLALTKSWQDAQPAQAKGCHNRNVRLPDLQKDCAKLTGVMAVSAHVRGVGMVPFGRGRPRALLAISRSIA